MVISLSRQMEEDGRRGGTASRSPDQRVICFAFRAEPIINRRLWSGQLGGLKQQRAIAIDLCHSRSPIESPPIKR